MVARRVPSDDEDRVALVEIFKHDGSGAGAKRSLKADAASLMAVVATVVNVIRPVDTGKELQEKSRFVA